MDTFLEFSHILTDVGSTNTGVTLDIYVVTEGNDDFLDLLGQLASRGKNEGLSTLDGEIYLLED